MTIHDELARQRRLDLRPTRARAPQRSPHSRSTVADDLAPLVRAAAARDSQAWESLVARFTPTLRSVVRGYRLNTADVDDVVQTAWTATFTHIDRLREPEAIGGWLLVTARREALRTLHRRQREIPSAEACEPEQDTRSTPEGTLLAAELRGTVHAAVERLPERQRLLLSAMSRDGVSYADLARKLNIPLGSIGPTRERALARLRRDRQLAAFHAVAG